MDLRERSRLQFERWSEGYQGGLAQRLYFNPTNRMLLRRVSLYDRVRVLDVGCGTGQLLLDVHRRCSSARLSGIDLCTGMIRQARLLLGETATLEVRDSQDLPFADGSFDVVLCTHSFHHYPDQPAVLREMRRVLRPGGGILLLDSDPEPLWGRLLWDGFIVWAEGPVRHRSAREMRDLYRDAGFMTVGQDRGFPWCPVLLTIGVKDGNHSDAFRVGDLTVESPAGEDGVT